MTKANGSTGNIERVTLADLGDNDAYVATISEARVQNFSRNYLSTDDEKVVIRFTEFGAKDFILNATNYRALSERYGRGVDNNFVDWKGRPCVLSKTETTDLQNNKMWAVWVAPRKIWDEAMAAVAPVAKPTTETAKPRKAAKPRKRSK